MKNYFIYSLVLIIGLFSCIKDEKPYADTVISIDISSNDCLHLSKVFKKNIEYITLDSPEDNLIGSISKLSVTANYIAIADYYNTRSVFIFSRKGKFISQISHIGEGPFEYTVLKDFYIDDISKTIGVFSLNGKLIIYDIEGNGIEEVPLGLHAVKYQKMGDRIFVSGVDSDYWLHVLSENATREEYFIPIANDFGLEFGPFNSFSGTRDSVLFLPNLQQIFYCYANSRVFPKYQVNFGKHNIPSQVINACQNFDDYLMRCRKGNYAHVIDKFSETKKYLYFSYALNDKTYHAFFNRTTSEVTNAMKVENDIDGIDFYGLMGSFDNGIIQTRWSIEISENVERLKKKMSNDEWASYQNNNKEIIKIASNASDTDNPVVIIYSYK